MSPLNGIHSHISCSHLPPALHFPLSDIPALEGLALQQPVIITGLNKLGKCVPW